MVNPFCLQGEFFALKGVTAEGAIYQHEIESFFVGR
jgi:hypothetical protein